MKVAIYARVSTDSDNQLNSLSNQQKHYNDYCNQHDYEMIHMYVDEGLSGTKLKREQFLNMLYDAGLNIIKDEDGIRFRVSKREPKFEYIITKDVSRFSRNVNAIQAVKTLRKKGVYVLFEQNSIDTKDNKYEFMLNLFLNFAQQESIDRSMKVKFGLEQRAKEGKYHFASERLFGYEYHTDTKTISLVPSEAKVVKRVFDYYVNDKIGSRHIAERLNNDGLTTQNNKKWNANAIVRMLNQEKYTGNAHLLKYTYGDVTDENRQKTQKNEEQWIYHENLIPSIIDIETYQKAQEIMASRTTKKRGTNPPRNIFSKKLKCAKCGKNYIRSNQRQHGNTYYFYACATRRRTKECDNASVTLIRLLEEMKPYQGYKLHDILTKRQETITAMLKSNISVLQIKKKFANEKREQIQQEIIKIESDIDKLFNSFMNSSDIVKEAVERKIEELQTKKSKFELDIFNYDDVNIDAEIKRNNDVINHIKKTVNNKSIYTLDEVMSFVSEIIVDDKKLQVKFTFENLLPTSEEVTNMKDYLNGNVSNLSKMLNDIKESIMK